MEPDAEDSGAILEPLNGAPNVLVTDAQSRGRVLTVTSNPHPRPSRRTQRPALTLIGGGVNR